MGKWVRKDPCPTCRAQGEDDTGDNLVVYEDGSAFCFRCDKDFRHHDKSLTSNVPNTPNKKKLDFLTGSYMELDNRAISKKTCEFYKYQVDISGKHIANYYDSAGTLHKQKIRTYDKRFFDTGDATYMGLFGMQLFKPNKKLFVTLTEGEIDTLSTAQVYGCRFPVVSLPGGTGSGKRSIPANLEWLLQFSHVVLMFDNDEAGKKATRRAIDDLSDTLVCVVRWPEGVNDANDLLRKGRVEELRNLIHSAVPVIPDSIIDLGTIVKKALEPKEVGLSWGWEGLDRPTFGLRHHELILFGAGSSVGKTTFLNQVALTLVFQHKQKIGIFSFEESELQSTEKLTGLIVNQRISLPGAIYDYEHAVKAGEQGLSGMAYAVKTSVGLDSVEKVITKIKYLVKVLGIHWIFLDHLTYIASLIPGDERRGLDVAMASFQKIVKELPCTLFVVSHLSSPNIFSSKDPNTSKTFEQGRRPVSKDLRGSQSLQYYSSTIMLLSRDIYSVESTTLIELAKNKIDGDRVGDTVELEFSRVTGRLEEVEGII